MVNHNGKPKIDVVIYEQNRRRIAPEVLKPYAGQWVAFSGDGTGVLASGPDLETAEADLADGVFPAMRSARRGWPPKARRAGFESSLFLLHLPVRQPIVTLAGFRHRPMIPVTFIASVTSRVVDGLLKTEADDSLFPLDVATKLGIDLSSAPSISSAAPEMTPYKV